MGLCQVLKLAQVVDHISDTRMGELESEKKEQLVKCLQIFVSHGKGQSVVVKVGVEGRSCLV